LIDPSTGRNDGSPAEPPRPRHGRASVHPLLWSFFFSIAGFVGLLALGCAGRPAPAPAAPPSAATGAEGAGFTILQINDTYKIEGLEAGRVGGMARVRTLRRELEAEGRPVLVLHGGDIFFPSVMSKYLKGEGMVDALNALDGSEDFDARFVATFGNHEFDDRDPAVLFARLAQSEFSWVSSNVRFRAAASEALAPLSTRFGNVHETMVLDLGGLRVGLLGLTLDDQTRDWLDYGYAIESRNRIVRAAIEGLRAEGAEVLIAVTHQEIGQDERLARDFPELDWIVGGHEHVYLSRQVGATGITKADADAKSAIRIDVRPGAGRPRLAARKIDLVGQDVAPDPGMQGRVARWLVRLAEAVKGQSGHDLLDVVATTEQALEGVEPTIRGRESALGNFLADALRARLATDLAFVNGGAIRVNDDVPPGGDVRVYEMEGIFYYDNRPVATEISGAQLLELLRKSVSEAALGHGRFLQVSGIRFRYHARPEGYGETTRVEAGEVEVRPLGAAEFVPLELGRTYSVATLDYLWKNGSRDGYPLFSFGAGGASPPLLPRPELSWRGITEEAITALPGRRITTEIEGRIERIQD
jgi:5'-nucleotidase